MLLFIVILCTFWLPSGTCKEIPQSTDIIIEELQKSFLHQQRKLEQQERKLEQQQRKLEQQDRLLENVVVESGVTRELLEKAVMSVSILTLCRKTCGAQKLS